ncbi:hypothetical protein FBU59_001267 [Linderina macrospora]|uniref:Uncharacterized protein n=1 Tax=Linderina macrospora TaxID=4868 RepID=A0ACC1JEC7_9FUNG|nr:hypothetical protein FBU59_001267 [Linderina macrospora]
MNGREAVGLARYAFQLANAHTLPLPPFALCIGLEKKVAILEKVQDILANGDGNVTVSVQEQNRHA